MKPQRSFDSMLDELRTFASLQPAIHARWDYAIVGLSEENPYHDYYIWRDGEEGTPPNDLRGCFGGSAWERVPQVKQYYFHQFSVNTRSMIIFIWCFSAS